MLRLCQSKPASKTTKRRARASPCRPSVALLPFARLSAKVPPSALVGYRPYVAGLFVGGVGAISIATDLGASALPLTEGLNARGQNVCCRRKNLPAMWAEDGPSCLNGSM